MLFDVESIKKGRTALIRHRGDFSDLIIAEADGSWLSTIDGRRILDFTSGQMCATLGHSHPAIRSALDIAMSKVQHLQSRMLSPDVIELAHELLALLPEPLARLMLISNGGEANEAALRMAKLCTGGHEVIAFAGSWHGMTAEAASATYAPARCGYGPVVPGGLLMPTPNCYRCPIRHCRDQCDLTCLDVGMELIDRQTTGAPAAAIVEPILSSGGVVPLPPGYARRFRALTADRGFFLIFDEAQTALGRLGYMFGFERHGTVPDFVTLSKTLGGGFPVAAMVTTANIEQTAFDRNYIHFTSHMYDPIAAAIGRSVLATILSESLAERARESGDRLRRGLLAMQAEHESIGDVRGEGLLIGIDLVADRHTRNPANSLAAAVARRCLELGLVVNLVRMHSVASVLRLAPPITVTSAECDLALEILDRAISESERNVPGEKP